MVLVSPCNFPPVIRTDDTIIAKTNTLLRTTKPLQDGSVNHT